MTPEQAACILGLERPWTPLAIKKAYKRCAKDAHPDHGGSDEAFKRVARARQVLDDYLEKGSPGREPQERQKSSNRDWDAWAPPEDWETEEEEDDVPLSAWFEVESVCVEGGPPISASFRAQLVELEKKVLNKFGEAIQRQYLIALYPSVPIELPGQTVAVVIRDEGTLSLLVREVAQRSHDKTGKVTVFWIDPLKEPVITEENIRSHGRYSETESFGAHSYSYAAHARFYGSDYWP